VEAQESVSKVTPVKQYKRHGILVDTVIRLIREKPLGTVGGIIVLILLLSGIFADLLAPYGMSETHRDAMMEPPSSEYILGTDNLGRDIFSRIIYGARVSMYIGLAGPALEVLIAMLIGGVSGLIGGKYDLIVQRFVDAWMCFPPLFILLTVMALLGPSIASVILVLGLSAGIGASRVVRSAVIGIKTNIYIDAARVIGCSQWRIALRHVLPNIAAPIIIIFTVAMGAMILIESTLSFLGFGVPPPQPSWGAMLSGPARTQMYEAPWMAIWPGLALAIVVYGINMFGDALRDILDPRLRGGLGRYSGVRAKRAKKHREAAQ